MSDVPVVNPFSAPSLAQTIAKSLPPNASQQLKSAIEAIALAIHAGMLNVGFTLKAFGEQNIGKSYLPRESSIQDPFLTFAKNHKLQNHNRYLGIGMPLLTSTSDIHTHGRPWSIS